MKIERRTFITNSSNQDSVPLICLKKIIFCPEDVHMIRQKVFSVDECIKLIDNFIMNQYRW